MNEIIISCKEDLLSNILVLKDRIRDIFENSSSQDEAYKKKNKLYFEGWYKKNSHFKKIIKLFMSVPVCEYMFITPISKESLFQYLVIKRIPLNWLDPRKAQDMVLEPPKAFRII